MEIVTLIAPHQEFIDFMAMENGVLKNIKYYRSINGRNFYNASICKKEGNTHYSHTCFKVMKSKESYYSKYITKDGFTIDVKGKLKIWFNKSVYQIPAIGEVFRYYNFNWLSEKVHPYITKGIMEKMFAGKITNNHDLIKAYFKAVRINASPASFLKLIETLAMSKVDFLRSMGTAKDVNHFIEYVISEDKDYNKSQIINDMVQEAQILNKKIDYTWSLNRLKEEHKSWTKEIMKIEIDALDETILDYVDKFDRYTPEGFTLLKTQREVFSEGTMMHHCIYTAYWDSIKENRYLPYHISINGEEATLGVYIESDCIRFNQCYLKFNQSISSSLSTIVKEFVEDLNDQAKKDGLLKKQSLPF